MLLSFQILMVLAAFVFVALPLRSFKGQLTRIALPLAVFIGALSIGLYQRIGTPDAESHAAAELPGIDEMVASLDARLKENPDDLNGWKMLGRSYVELKDFPKAIAAYETAVEMESSGNAQTLVDLGEVVLMEDRNSLQGRAGQLFESALALEPGNPKGLFYGGMASANNGNVEEAADRWEALLATSPPANIEQLIRARVAEWRGEPPPAVMAEQPGSIITANVSVDNEAAATIDPRATVFLIARDPAQPRPPIAAVRRQAGELPAAIALSDADAMIPGRVPSGFAELEIIARVSHSGEPVAQPGDWFGQAVVRIADGSEIDIVINQQVQ
ncbi:MAG: hypothetical protein KJO31_03220 [Gammaproteobacteria bacterium]|nr:hypothetical protein [Gammaproteobacteria bacterium]